MLLEPVSNLPRLSFIEMREVEVMPGFVADIRYVRPEAPPLPVQSMTPETSLRFE